MFVFTIGIKTSKKKKGKEKKKNIYIQTSKSLQHHNPSPRHSESPLLVCLLKSSLILQIPLDPSRDCTYLFLHIYRFSQPHMTKFVRKVERGRGW